MGIYTDAAGEWQGPHRPIMPACNYSACRGTRWGFGGVGEQCLSWRFERQSSSVATPDVEEGELEGAAGVAQEHFGECSLIKNLEQFALFPLVRCHIHW